MNKVADSILFFFSCFLVILSVIMMMVKGASPESLILIAIWARLMSWRVGDEHET